METFVNQLEPVGTSWNQLEPVGTSWNQLEPVGTSWNQSERSLWGTEQGSHIHCQCSVCDINGGVLINNNKLYIVQFYCTDLQRTKNSNWFLLSLNKTT